MAIIISLLMSLGIFSNPSNSSQAVNTQDSKFQQDHSNAKGWEWDGTN